MFAIRRRLNLVNRFEDVLRSGLFENEKEFVRALQWRMAKHDVMINTKNIIDMYGNIKKNEMDDCVICENIINMKDYVLSEDQNLI